MKNENLNELFNQLSPEYREMYTDIVSNMIAYKAVVKFIRLVLEEEQNNPDRASFMFLVTRFREIEYKLSPSNINSYYEDIISIYAVYRTKPKQDIENDMPKLKQFAQEAHERVKKIGDEEIEVLKKISQEINSIIDKP